MKDQERLFKSELRPEKFTVEVILSKLHIWKITACWEEKRQKEDNTTGQSEAATVTLAREDDTGYQGKGCAAREKWLDSQDDGELELLELGN